MRCYICNSETDVNAMADLEEEAWDIVVAHHMLIACDGPDEQFDEDDNVVLCAACVHEATS